MMLFRFAKWMEERNRLNRLIAETDGDPSSYINEKVRLERQMLRQAHQWLEPGKITEEQAYVLHSLDELTDTSPVPGLTGADALPMPVPIPMPSRPAIAAEPELKPEYAFASTALVRVPEELLHLPFASDDAHLHTQPQ